LHRYSGFTNNTMSIYVDNAATTPMSGTVVDAMQDAMRQVFGNPSSIHAEGRKARTLVEQARRVVARSLNASIGEVFFTSCGTESNNMVLKGAVRDLGIRHIISSPTEHHCVLHSLESLQRDAGVRVSLLEVDGRGNPDLNQLENMLASSSEKALVSLMHANNEIGTMADLPLVGSICAEHGAHFHTDAVQTVGYFPIDVSLAKVHFLSGSAHKFHGPKGAGFVFIRNDAMLRPFLDGGSQERNMRAGTENVAGIVGLAQALSEATLEMEARRQHIMDLRAQLRAQIAEAFPQARFNGMPDGARQHHKILSVSFPASAKAELLVPKLDILGVCASGGSACSSGVEHSSHVLEAIKSPPDCHTVRFSFSHLNSKNEIDALVSALKKAL
jgi:cysteine desulfurase